MFRLSLFVGILMMIFALIERTTLFFVAGTILLLIAAYGEMSKPQQKSLFSRFKGYFRTRKVSSQQAKYQNEIDFINDWLIRFAKRFQALVYSRYQMTKDGRILFLENEEEREDAEEVYSQFRDLMLSKGINIPDENLRMMLNFYVMEDRLEQFSQKLMKIIDTKPEVLPLLRLYAEEELRLMDTDHAKHYWNHNTLIHYLERNYTLKEIREVLPKWPKNKGESLHSLLSQIKTDVLKSWKCKQLEKWLLGEENGEVITLARFDNTVMQHHEFRKDVVRLMESMGYRVGINDEHHESVDLIVERTGVKYAVLLKPLHEGEVVMAQTIQEGYVARTLVKAQGAMIISNQYVSQAAKELAQKLGILLVDRDVLSQWITRYTDPFEKLSI